MKMLKQYNRIGIIITLLCILVSISVVNAKTAGETYQEKLARLKPEDVKGRYELGVWCKKNGLSEEARSAFEKVIELNPDHSEARKELGYIKYKGKWIKPDGKTRVDYEEKLANLDESNARSQYELGLWCKQSKLWTEAIAHLTKASELTPDNKDFSKSLNEVSQLYEKEKEQRGIQFSLTIGVGYDETEANMKMFGEEVKEFSQILAKFTGGVMYVKEAVFADMCNDATYPYKGKPGIYNIIVATNAPGAAQIGAELMYLRPIGFNRMTLIHEFGHSHLGLRDEYDQNKRSADGRFFMDPCLCVMGSGEEARNSGFCNAQRHPQNAPNTPGCQELIIAKFKEQYPFITRAFERKPEDIKVPPKTKITIKNNGK